MGVDLVAWEYLKCVSPSARDCRWALYNCCVQISWEGIDGMCVVNSWVESLFPPVSEIHIHPKRPNERTEVLRNRSVFWGLLNNVPCIKIWVDNVFFPHIDRNAISCIWVWIHTIGLSTWLMISSSTVRLYWRQYQRVQDRICNRNSNCVVKRVVPTCCRVCHTWYAPQSLFFR